MQKDFGSKIDLKLVKMGAKCGKLGLKTYRNWRNFVLLVSKLVFREIDVVIKDSKTELE